MRAGLIDDFVRNSLPVPFCPCHFVHAILSNTILSVYHFVHTILSVPFCPLPFCPRTPHLNHGFLVLRIPKLTTYLVYPFLTCTDAFSRFHPPKMGGIFSKKKKGDGGKSTNVKAGKNNPRTIGSTMSLVEGSSGVSATPNPYVNDNTARQQTRKMSDPGPLFGKSATLSRPMPPTRTSVSIWFGVVG